MTEQEFEAIYGVDTWSCIMLLEYLLEYDDGVGICLGYQSREMIENQLKRLKDIKVIVRNFNTPMAYQHLPLSKEDQEKLYWIGREKSK